MEEMTLESGSKLGPYEIVAPIGAGGMGDVYRAHDPRVGRDVAIKVSAEQFGERFEREIRAVASLNHSNICILHDVGPNYLVMELVEGPTLADRIKQGPIPLEESLEIARQIADALEAAHEKGIVHRDLKPANIKIKPDGTVKVLDFGLAKVGGTPAVSSDNSPTLSVAQTAAGVILGTAAYMSPEQAKGKIVDKRADIWAFGVVLYEMLTGKQLFAGETVSDTLASVLKEEPNWEKIPAKVQPLLRSCLEKDPARRLRDIGDAWRLLDQATEIAPVHKTRAAWLWAAVTAISTIALAVALWALGSSQNPADRPLVRLNVNLGDDVALPPLRDGKNSIAISPDGTRIAYISGDPPRLSTRRLDKPTATELPGTTGATSCFFSHDGQWIGFPAGEKLNKILVEGGAVVPLGNANAEAFAGANWSENGSILWGELGRNLNQIPSTGGPPAAVVELAKGEMGQGAPQILPGGKAILFISVTPPAGINNIKVEVLTYSNQRRKVLMRGFTSVRYLETTQTSGHLVYTNGSTLFAVPFDPEKLEIIGAAVPVLNDLAQAPIAGNVQYDISDTGTLVYRRLSSSTESALSVLQWVDTAGKKEPLIQKPGEYFAPRLSPDGRRLVFVLREEGGSRDIWVYDIQREAMTRLTFEKGSYLLPVWSPDGKYIFYGSISGGLFCTRADGAIQPQLLIQNPGFGMPFSVAKDGRKLAFVTASESGSSRQIWTLPLEEQNGRMKAGKPERFLESRFNDLSPAFSPDGRWLAYQSDDSGKNEVWVRPFPPPASGQGGKWQVSNNGGTAPVWSPDRQHLLYQAGDQIMSVEYRAKGDAFEVAKPKVWISKLGGTMWDLAPNNKRVLVWSPVDTGGAPKKDNEVIFLLNFFDELRRRAPAGK
jgi:serine/threonine protein kinase/WD40 repeat protein